MCCSGVVQASNSPLAGSEAADNAGSQGSAHGAGNVPLLPLL